MSSKHNSRGTRTLVAALAVAAFGLAGVAATPGVASADTVTVQSTSFGVFPKPECRVKRDELRAHNFIANCVWHPPIKMGYEELLVG